MKPCAKNRKRIALLIASALDSREASELRAHFKHCPGCRQYERELASICHDYSMAARELPEVSPQGSFHQRLVNRIREDQRAAAAVSILAFLRRRRVDWRIVMPAGVLATLVLVSWLRPGRQTGSSNAVPPAPMVAAATTDTAPTYSNYRMAANNSLEALDELLNRQAARSLGPTEVLTASMLTSSDAGD